MYNEYMEYNRPKVGVGVIVIKNDKVLLGKRKNAHGDGSWSFAGGHLEKNESLEECAKREVMEEAGITIKNIKPLTFTNDIFEKEEKHYITLFLTADYDAGEVRVMEPEKCDGWEWFDWNDLPQPLFLAINNFLKQGINPIRQKDLVNEV